MASSRPSFRRCEWLKKGKTFWRPRRSGPSPTLVLSHCGECRDLLPLRKHMCNDQWAVTSGDALLLSVMRGKMSIWGRGQIPVAVSWHPHPLAQALSVVGPELSEVVYISNIWIQKINRKKSAARSSRGPATRRAEGDVARPTTHTHTPTVLGWHLWHIRSKHIGARNSRHVRPCRKKKRASQ